MTTEITNRKNKIILHQPDNAIELEVLVENETVWPSQAQMVMLFVRDRTVITKHINNIFREGELDKKAMCIFCTLQIQTEKCNSNHLHAPAFACVAVGYCNEIVLMIFAKNKNLWSAI